MAIHRHPVSPDYQGLPALQKNPVEPGRSERQRPGKRKIGGDLQGEPIFRLPGPAPGSQVPFKKAQVRGGGQKETQGSRYTSAGGHLVVRFDGKRFSGRAGASRSAGPANGISDDDNCSRGEGTVGAEAHRGWRTSRMPRAMWPTRPTVGPEPTSVMRTSALAISASERSQSYRSVQGGVSSAIVAQE